MSRESTIGGDVNDSKALKTCPMCLATSVVSKLCMGSEPGFYVDCLPPAYCFVPCGHMASEATVKYWADVPIPYEYVNLDFQSACPFCAVPLGIESVSPGYVKFIFSRQVWLLNSKKKQVKDESFTMQRTSYTGFN